MRFWCKSVFSDSYTGRARGPTSLKRPISSTRVMTVLTCVEVSKKMRDISTRAGGGGPNCLGSDVSVC